MTRRASRTMTITMSVPTTALASRQPSESKPRSFSPAPMSHLPTSGWTTIEGVSFCIDGL